MSAGEFLGYLPGDVNSKMEPFTIPILDALREIWVRAAAPPPERRLGAAPGVPRRPACARGRRRRRR